MGPGVRRDDTEDGNADVHPLTLFENEIRKLLVVPGLTRDP
jgi:hypothetical protein